jgi:hypothetical protein
MSSSTAANHDLPSFPGLPVLGSCWPEARLFDSLKYGTVNYCRGHLRYEPDAVDCFYFADQVCWVLLPATGEWIQTRSVGSPIAFPCPNAPEPPVCPRMH